MRETFRFIFYLVIWIAVPIALYHYAQLKISIPSGLDFLIIAFAISFFTYFHRPFYYLRLSTRGDLGTMILMGCLIIIYLASLVIIPSMDQEEGMKTCGRLSMEKRCYRLPEVVCNTMWNKYENECRKELKTDLGDRVTALIGPSLRRCIRQRFDKSMYYTRNTSDSQCQDFFADLK